MFRYKISLFLFVFAGVNLFQSVLSDGLPKYDESMIPQWAVEDESERKFGFGAQFDFFDLLKREIATFKETNNLPEPFHIDKKVETLRSAHLAVDKLLQNQFHFKLDDVIDEAIDISMKIGKSLINNSGVDVTNLEKDFKKLIEWFLRVRDFLMKNKKFGNLGVFKGLDSVARILFDVSKWIKNNIEQRERRLPHSRNH
ncbi:uncharacterized protein LOC130891111 [Diorhabda carinulata]|uniref:uncharacterized protein LOC130891111 n=1 Tax=Diorhabda carinulata TaxID=1163345 RepID=UPI0025A0FE85|nr:uncharacterized protein LOC130891111 [Diorhabda carinulata]